MKQCNVICTALFAFAFAAFLSSCEQTVMVESVVHPDGSLDRTIVLDDADSAKVAKNIFGAGKTSGWDVIVESHKTKPDSAKDSTTVNTITFHKHFTSVEEANLVTDTDTDTLFRIRSGFEKKFRWFYTYIRYSDTYVALNHFKRVEQDDYFTPEDYSFIKRLPPEGKSISKADSGFLSLLNSRIYDSFATRVMFEEYFQILEQILQKNNQGQDWIEKLHRKKDGTYRQLVKNGGDTMEDKFMINYLTDSLHVPLAAATIKKDYEELLPALEKRIGFATDANEGKYTHIVKMPWEVVETNADSLHANDLFWKPPVIKFVLTDYTMYAVSRQLNVWALIVSGLVVAATVVIFVKRRR